MIAIFGSAVLAAGAGVATNAFSDGWAWPWGVALAVLVLAQAFAQLWLRRLDRQEQTTEPPTGAGAVTGPVTGSTIVTGDRSVGTVSGGTVVTGDGNVLGGPAGERQ